MDLPIENGGSFHGYDSMLTRPGSSTIDIYGCHETWRQLERNRFLQDKHHHDGGLLVAVAFRQCTFAKTRLFGHVGFFDGEYPLVIEHSEMVLL